MDWLSGSDCDNSKILNNVLVSMDCVEAKISELWTVIRDAFELYEQAKMAMERMCNELDKVDTFLPYNDRIGMIYEDMKSILEDIENFENEFAEYKERD